MNAVPESVYLCIIVPKKKLAKVSTGGQGNHTVLSKASLIQGYNMLQ